MNNTKEDRAREQAEAQMRSIAEMVRAVREAQEAEESDKEDEAIEAIKEDALDIQVRSGWHALNESDGGEGEYLILLCTGGPAVRIVGTLGRFSEPESASVQYQDWGTPWTEYHGDAYNDCDEETLLKYVRCFYFGE